MARGRKQGITSRSSVYFRHEVAERRCLRCQRTFTSEGRHNRICDTCKHGMRYLTMDGRTYYNALNPPLPEEGS